MQQKQRTNVMLTDDEHARLRLVCVRLHITVMEAVRQAVLEWLEQEEKKNREGMNEADHIDRN